ncbi:hypothetical protein [Paenibacillus sp. DCT19]|uniref:hypothetical protein n=1 Tax=Paenibacillus sp. DCT19 TaxID=2211212 RepID=UPI000FE19531|nr:hypothetical protein [Paenibacillus sp. DCT19]
MIQMHFEPSGVTTIYMFFSGLFGISFAIAGLVALIWAIIVLSKTNTYLKLLIEDRRKRDYSSQNQHATSLKEEQWNPEEKR